MISIVIPIYNEEELVEKLNDSIANALKEVVDDWEVVYVNDGSTDSSLDLLKTLQAVDSHVVVVELSRNWRLLNAAVSLILGEETMVDFLQPGDRRESGQGRLSFLQSCAGSRAKRGLPRACSSARE